MSTKQHQIGWQYHESLIYCFIVKWATLNWTLGPLQRYSCHLSLYSMRFIDPPLHIVSFYVLKYILLLLLFRNIDQKKTLEFHSVSGRPMAIVHNSPKSKNIKTHECESDTTMSCLNDVLVIGNGMRSFTARNCLPSVNLPISILCDKFIVFRLK